MIHLYINDKAGYNHNVRCKNGNYHAKRTYNVFEVTCPKCRERVTYDEVRTGIIKKIGLN